MPLDKKTAVNAVNGITRWSLLEGLMINGIAMMASSAIMSRLEWGMIGFRA